MDKKTLPGEGKKYRPRAMQATTDRYYKEQEEELHKRLGTRPLTDKEERQLKKKWDKESAEMERKTRQEFAELRMKREKEINDFARENNIPEDAKILLENSIFSEYEGRDIQASKLGELVAEKYPQLYDAILKYLEKYRIKMLLEGSIDRYKYYFEKTRKEIESKKKIKKVKPKIKDVDDCGENYQRKHISFKNKNGKEVSYYRCYKIPKAKNKK